MISYISKILIKLTLPVSGVFTAGDDGDEPTGIYWKDSVCFNGVVEGVEVTKPVSKKGKKIWSG